MAMASQAEARVCRDAEKRKQGQFVNRHFMAAVIAMDVDEVDPKVSAVKGTASSLSIKSSSSRISKAAMRRPIVQQSKPTPTPKVYNTDPMGFRNLVQELTGYAPSSEQQPPDPASPTPAPALVTRSSPAPAAAAAAAPSRTTNTRLQRMAPPPLSPTVSFSFKHQQQQQQQQQQQESQADVVSPSAHPLSPLSKRVSPMPLLSFSPLPVLSPTDNVWANFESPNTAALKKFAQSIAEEGGAAATSRMGFPWSPTFQACFGMSSPGLAPAAELFPEVKMLDPPDKTCQSGGSSGVAGSKEFSFHQVKN